METGLGRQQSFEHSAEGQRSTTNLPLATSVTRLIDQCTSLQGILQAEFAWHKGMVHWAEMRKTNVSTWRAKVSGTPIPKEE